MQYQENSAVIEPKKGKREEPVPSACLLVFTPKDIELFMESFPEKPRRTHRIFLADVYRGVYQGREIAFAGPMMGAPQAVMVLEKLIALGAREIIGVGWCGSLQPHVNIGDVVTPIGAVSEEGTSGHYPLSISAPGPSIELLATLRESLAGKDIRVHEGSVWTTDAPYRETVGKVRRLQAEGVLGVDMESSALLTVAAFRNVRLVLVLVVSDNLSGLKWRHGFRDPVFHRTRERVAALTLAGICPRI